MKKRDIPMGRIPVHLQEGSWTPWRINWLILALETFMTLQAASRGMDYVQPRPPMPVPPSLTTMEAALPLPLWGAGFLALAGLVFIGLYAGWWLPIVIGHGGLTGLYGAFAYGVLDQAPMRSTPIALIGVAILVPGLYLGATRWFSWRWLRIVTALTLTVIGGWVTSYGMGYDFRTGTSLMTAAAAHAVFAIGVAYIAHWRPPAERT